MNRRAISSVQSLSRVRLFVTPWTAACHTSLSTTNSQSLLKLMSIELVTPCNCLILCCPLPLLPSIFPSIKVFSKESVLCIRWPKSFSLSISPSSEYTWLISSCSYPIQLYLFFAHLYQIIFIWPKCVGPQGKSRVTNMNYSLWVKNLLNSPVTSKLTWCKELIS